LVKHGKTGYLVPPEDSAALRDGIQALLSDPDRRKSLGLAARKLVERQYTWDKAAAKYLSLMQDVIG